MAAMKRLPIIAAIFALALPASALAQKPKPKVPPAKPEAAKDARRDADKPPAIDAGKLIAEQLVPLAEEWQRVNESGTTEQQKVARATLIKKANEQLKRSPVVFRFKISDIVSVASGNGYLDPAQIPANRPDARYSVRVKSLEGLVGEDGYQPYWSAERSVYWKPKGGSAEGLAVNPGDILEITGRPLLGQQIPIEYSKQGIPDKIIVLVGSGQLQVALGNYKIKIVPQKPPEDDSE